jgi:hypothetical protein
MVGLALGNSYFLTVYTMLWSDIPRCKTPADEIIPGLLGNIKSICVVVVSQTLISSLIAWDNLYKEHNVCNLRVCVSGLIYWNRNLNPLLQYNNFLIFQVTFKEKHFEVIKYILLRVRWSIPRSYQERPTLLLSDLHTYIISKLSETYKSFLSRYGKVIFNIKSHTTPASITNYLILV